MSAGNLAVNYSPAYFTYHGMPYQGDFLLFNNGLVGTSGVKSPSLSLARYLTLSEGEQNYFGLDNVNYTRKPLQTPYSAGGDFASYGNILTSLKSIASSPSQPRDLLIPLKEKGVEHAAINGNVFDDLLVSRFYPTADYSPCQGDISWPIELFKPGIAGCNKFVTFRDLDIPEADLIAEAGYYEDYGLYGVNWDFFQLADQVAYIRPHEVKFIYQTGYTFYYDWIGIDTGSWSFNGPTLSRQLIADYTFSISFDAAHGAHQWPFLVHRDIKVSIVPNYSGQSGAPRLSDCFIVEDGSTVTPLEGSAGLRADYGLLFEPFYDTARYNSSVKVSKIGHPALATLIAQPSKDLSKNFAGFRSCSKDPKTADRALHMHNMMLTFISDIRPSGFLAAKDAMKKNVSAYSFNLLQDLQHLKDIASVLPDLGELGRLCADATKGDLSVIPRIIDYLTSAILKYNFTQRPLVKDGREILATDLLSSLRAITKYQEFTWYGEFRYPFLPEENFMKDGTLELVTRVKLRGSVDLTSFLATCFALNGAGALPTLSRVWSLVPFSFVVDWFTNESKRLESVDYQFLYLALNTYWCVYSYKLHYTPSVQELSRYNLSTDPDDPLVYTVYKRELSRLMPRLTESRFDLQRRTSGPDPVTVGSLVWQLL